MTDTTTPSIDDLRKAWEEATALCEQIAAEEPRGELLFPEGHRFNDGKRMLAPDQSARLTQARFRRNELTLQLHRARKLQRTESGAL